MWVNVCRAGRFSDIQIRRGPFVRSEMSAHVRVDTVDEIGDDFEELRPPKSPEFSTLALRNADLRPATKWTAPSVRNVLINFGFDLLNLRKISLR